MNRSSASLGQPTSNLAEKMTAVLNGCVASTLECSTLVLCERFEMRHVLVGYAAGYNSPELGAWILRIPMGTVSGLLPWV